MTASGALISGSPILRMMTSSPRSRAAAASPCVRQASAPSPPMRSTSGENFIAATLLESREEEAGLALRDPLHQPDARQPAIEGFQAIGAQLDDDVPAAVRAVQGRHRGVAAKRFDDSVDAIALDGYGHQGADPVLFHRWLEPDRVARDRAIGFEPRHPVLDRPTRYAQ